MTDLTHPTLTSARFELAAARLLLAPGGFAQTVEAGAVAAALERLDRIGALLAVVEEARPLTRVDGAGAQSMSVAELMQQHPGSEADLFYVCDRALRTGSSAYTSLAGDHVTVCCTDRAALTSQLDQFADCNGDLMLKEGIQWPAQD